MKELSLTPADQELINAAQVTLEKLYKKNWHGVAAAIRSTDGEIFTAVHLEGSIGRTAVCAEAIALGKAMSEGTHEFTTIVAMWYPGDDTTKESAVAPPCGMCREMLFDYAPNIEVITQTDGRVCKVALADLLPNRADHEYKM